MFKLWRIRSGASSSNRPACFRLRNNVSIEGQQPRRRSSFEAHFESLTAPKKPDGDHKGAVGSRDPVLSQGYLEIVPRTNTFTSPFEAAATVSRNPLQDGDHKDAVDIRDPVIPQSCPDIIPKTDTFTSPLEATATADGGMGGKTTSTSPRLFEIAPHARDTCISSHGLGSWVIIPDVLRPDPAMLSYLSSTNDEKALGVERGQPRTRRLGRFGMRPSRAREQSLLALTLDYTRYIHDAPGISLVHAPNKFFELVRFVFAPKRELELERRCFQPEDVVCWGWILAADTADIAVNRLHIVTNLATYAQQNSPIRALPFFLFTIILRSRVLSGSSLTMIVNVLVMRLKRGAAPSATFPDATTAMILLVRLVRHARRVSPGQLADIADLSGVLLKADYEANPLSAVILSRLTYNYNRLLSILSIATSQHPFRHIAIQQRAQLKVVRQMALMEPALPVTREGYQALAKVQVAHKKTTAERDWAQTKADSWPPWRKDKLGISEDLEYPGSESRAMDVLHRQIASGYMQTDWDRAAGVLAGWDTDKSPTIQTRAIIRKAPWTWLQSLVESLTSSESGNTLGSPEDIEVWVSRIRATRSTREAWACFCAWDASAGSKGRSQGPYAAMLDKLAARLQTTDPSMEQLPGDGREVYPPSVSPRDYLYVPVELSSFHDLYDKMRLDNVKPGGRSLALLLDHARTLSEGIIYLEQSTYSEVKKDVMLNAHKYDGGTIHSTLNFVQPVVLASFLTMLWRTRRDSGRSWYRPTSHAARLCPESSKPVSPEQISADAYVLDVVSRINLPAQVGNKILEILVQDLKTTTDLTTLNRGWKILLTLLEDMHESGTETDMATFYTVASAAVHITTTHPRYRLISRHASPRRKRHGLSLAKSLFIQAVVPSTSSILVSSLKSSKSRENDSRFDPASKTAILVHMRDRDAAVRASWLPYSADSSILEIPSPPALHLLVRVLSLYGDTGSILRLLRWMNRFTTELVSVREQMGNGERQMRSALCVAAMAIEEHSSAGPSELAEDIASVRKVIGDNVPLGGWPTDDELKRYLQKGRPADRPRQD